MLQFFCHPPLVAVPRGKFARCSSSGFGKAFCGSLCQIQQAPCEVNDSKKREVTRGGRKPLGTAGAELLEATVVLLPLPQPKCLGGLGLTICMGQGFLPTFCSDGGAICAMWA